jgi:hypothetical protein
MQLHSGTQFWPEDPRAEEIRLGDIAHALSNMCRFGGHCRSFYSVAQHSVMVSVEAERAASVDKTLVAIIGLLHDATEAYLVDVPRPIKRNLHGYKPMEELLARVIGERFGIELHQLPQLVEEADERALFTEKRDLLGPAPAPWGVAQGVSSEPYEHRIVPASPVEAKRMFIDRACELGLEP